MPNKLCVRVLCARVLFLLVGGLGLFQGELQAAKVSVPPASAPVLDTANVLGSSTVAQLNEILGQVRQGSGVQLSVLTVPSLEGLSVEEYAIDVASQWKLGQSKTDRGLLLLVAPTERRVRIEVGYGLEGELTDLQSGRIVNDVMVPYFKSGDWDSGVSAGVLSILKVVAPEALESLKLAAPEPQRRAKSGGRGISLFVAFFLFMLFFRLFSGRGGGRGGGGRAASAFLLGGLLGSGRGRSGFGGGGSSWGSWGGGGGGFGGGGASGSYQN